MKRLKFLLHILIAGNKMYKLSEGYKADSISGELSMHAVTTTTTGSRGSVTTLRQSMSVPISVELQESKCQPSSYSDTRAS